MSLDLRSKGVTSYVGIVSEEEISSNTQALTALSLHDICSLLSIPNCWACSIGFDTGTSQKDSFINARCRILDVSYIKYLYFLAILLTSRHTVEYTENSIFKCRQAIIGNNRMDWLLGMSSDGAASMIGRVSIAVIRIESLLKPNVYRVWCGAQQLEMPVQSAFDFRLRGTLPSILPSSISYMRRQVYFKAAICSYSPKEESTRWLPMGFLPVDYRSQT